MFIRRFAMLNPGGSDGGSPAGEGGEGGGGGNPPAGNPDGGTPPKDDPGESLDALPPWAQKMVKDLRKENAKYRTQHNQLETRLSTIENGMKTVLGGGDVDDKTPPEEKLQMMGAHLDTLATQNQILSLAIEHGIPKEGVEYFQFLLNKRVNSLGEGEEIDEEAITQIATEARSKTGGLPGGGQGTTSVTPNSAPGKGQNPGEITVEQFGKMTMVQKTELYRKNPAKYGELMSQLTKRRR